MTEAFADVNGITVCYSIQGEGFPIILLHGFGSKKESFMAQIPELSGHFKVITIDMRGAGKSSSKEDPVKAFWQSTRTSYYIKFRKHMEAEPNKKWYGLWSVDDLIKINTTNPPTERDIILQAEGTSTHHTLDRLHEIKNETLLIASTHDRVMPTTVMEEMSQRIPNSTLRIIDKAGHSSPLSRAPEVNQIIIDFLKE